MEISRAANSYQQIANQSNVINADKSMIESRNQSLSQIKDKVDITLPKNFSDQSVKVLNCQDGSKALMTFAEKDKTVSCYVQDANGKMTAIKTENLPQSMKNIDTSEKFNGYMNNAYAKTSVLSDGDIKVDVSQQLKGGMMSIARTVVIKGYIAYAYEVLNPDPAKGTAIALDIASRGGDFNAFKSESEVKKQIGNVIMFANSAQHPGHHAKDVMIRESAKMHNQLNQKFNELRQCILQNLDSDFIKGKSLAFGNVYADAIRVSREYDDLTFDF